MPKQIQTLLPPFLTAILLAIGLFHAQTALADDYCGGSFTSKCAEAVNPFRPAGPVENIIQNIYCGTTEQTCLSHQQGTFPNTQHKDPTTVTEGDPNYNKSVPRTIHEHHYINDSQSDANFFKRADVRKFRIYLRPDFNSNVDPSKIWCPIPPGGDTSFETCNYTGQSDFGLTSVTKTSNYVEYIFDINSEGKKPIIPGVNTAIDEGVYFYGNTSLPQNRALGLALKFDTKDMFTLDDKTAWAATTTSQAEIIDLVILKDNFYNVANAKNKTCLSAGYEETGWCNHYDSFTNTWHWVNIGTDATVWKTPPVTKSCDSLNINPTGPFTENQLPQTINVTSQTSGGLNLHYKWTASNSGSFISFDGNTYSGNPYYDTNTQTLINKLKALTGPITITVTGVDASNHSTEYPTNCKKTITINQQTLDCTNLTITPNGPFTEADMPQTFTVSSQTTGGLQLSYKWTASDPGSFVRFDDTFTYTGNPYIDTNTTTKAALLKALVNPITLYVTAVDKNNPNMEYPGPANACKKQVVINKGVPPNCKDLNPTVNGTDLGNSITINGGTTVTLAGDPEDTNNNPIDNIHWHEDGPGYFTADSTNPPGCPAPTSDFPAPAACKYIYHADASGNGSAWFEADPNNGTVPACRADIDVNAPPQGECLNINATISELPLYPGYDVTITVDPQYSWPATAQAVTWSETGNGYLTPGAGQCQVSQGASCTTHNYHAGTAGDTVSVTANPQDGNPLCAATWTVQEETQQKECDYLVLQPDELEKDGTTHLTATVYFDSVVNGQVTVQWSGNGTFTGVTPQNTQSKTINGTSITFETDFTVTPNNIYSSQASVRVIQVPAGVSNSYACRDQGDQSNPPEEDKCDWFIPSWYYYPNGDMLCLESNTGYNGGFTWEIGNNDPVNGLCSPIIPASTSWRFWATTEPDNEDCQDDGRTPPRKPTLEKYVSRRGVGAWTTILSVATIERNVDYKLVFNPNSPNTTAIIRDTISDGIPGYTYGDIFRQLNDGIIFWGNAMRVWEMGYGDLQICPDAEAEHCYTGSIDTNDLRLVKVDNRVEITYRGTIDPYLTEEICRIGAVCEEKFTNVTKADWQIYDSEGNIVEVSDIPLEASTDVQLFCQYILTRAAGDIFLETDLQGGVDIRQCSKYTTTPGLVVVPAPPATPSIVSTGTPTENIFTINHEVCTAGQAGTLPSELQQYYGQTISGLSSQICEVKLKPGTAWQQTTITNSIEENKTRISRWEEDNKFMLRDKIPVEDLIADAGVKDVYRVKGASLEFGADGQPWMLRDGEGAKTFIIEDGDLIISKDILYGTCNKTVCTVNDIASLAFIVLNGNIVVSNDVTEMSGVYFVQEQKTASGTAQNGRLVSSPQTSTYNQLFIYGSVYGDIQPLFSSRVFAGDPALGGAGIVIRFDERVILNTPPGLRDVLGFSQTEVAR